MKTKLSIAFSIMLITVIIAACNSGSAKEGSADEVKEASPALTFGGFETQVKWGRTSCFSRRL